RTKNSQKKCYFEIVENRNTETLHKIIQKHIKKGSVVYSNSWPSYCGIEKYGLKHKR
ncbi:10324_t:CDS:1, partial [Cetraspora pellucida]